MDNQAKSCNGWMFYVNGYKNPYDPEATWANDWLDGGIALEKQTKEYSFAMKHLLIEELENFKNWLITIQQRTLTSSYFEFIDADLFFDVIDVDGDITLRLVHGYENEDQVFIYTSISKLSDFIPTQIERINALLKQFPCRCAIEHNMLSKKH
jgi:hypothetical protein